MTRQYTKTLFAFDFDHTLLNENTDLYIVKMVKDGLPDHVKALYTKNNWTNYMCEVFKHIHALGVGPQQMNEFMCNMEFAPGMKELCMNIKERNQDQIIISDSNSIFIDTILKNGNLAGVFDSVFTNPARFDDSGCLSVEFYHEQHWCDMSTVNMCKGHILCEDYIAKQKEKGVIYDRVVYIGDGSNDLCPARRLNENDYLFCRKGYRLDKLLENVESRAKVKAKCIGYDNGKEIWDVIQQFI